MTKGVAATQESEDNTTIIGVIATERSFKWPRSGHRAGESVGVKIGDKFVICDKCSVPLRPGDRICAVGCKPDNNPRWGVQYRADAITVLPSKVHNSPLRLLQMGQDPTRKRVYRRELPKSSSIISGRICLPF